MPAASFQLKNPPPENYNKRGIPAPAGKADG